MLALGFDTSLQACSVALWRDGAVLARRSECMARGHAEALLPMIVAVMADGGAAWRDLTLIGVTVGPGTFTGIRIGLAAARGLGLAAGLPVAGVGTADAVAAGVASDDPRPLIVALDAKRAELFVRIGSNPIEALTPEAVAARFPGPARLAGDAAWRLAALMPRAELVAAGPPDAGVVAALAAARWLDGTALPARPLYLRAPDVHVPGPP
ncbi:MAG: tRNA (adenosine(37)-N6)-threonylcarbamoyltransferase complex dimerization subunit type 1 TsaB [Alphaproteobacteria bacterium]|nr:tRNA (adenosine(37)-N6)-threonylcarbamoyltransferase complex dimerization subunit type 1 TsaB [Alphaproteobacteria bacterium]